MNNDMEKLMSEPKNPFRVPEGYFDNITSRVMESIPVNEVKLIPEESKEGKEGKSTPHQFRKWRIYAAAASILVAVFGAGLLIHNDSMEPDTSLAKGKTVVHSSNSANAENNVDAMADYIMADDYELYAYMAYE